MFEIIITKDEPFEYFCLSCKQLRLCFEVERKICKNCGSNNIVTGKPYSLDREKLTKQAEDERLRTTDN